mmetsp:Transcript_23400/g.49819  ORF Transcript_23400/g.49819 Transcript_23400/m.49819 type:complete len:187 (+) Transcript_23400:1478-2038(+)
MQSRVELVNKEFLTQLTCTPLAKKSHPSTIINFVKEAKSSSKYCGSDVLISSATFFTKKYTTEPGIAPKIPTKRKATEKALLDGIACNIIRIVISAPREPTPPPRNFAQKYSEISWLSRVAPKPPHKPDVTKHVFNSALSKHILHLSGIISNEKKNAGMMHNEEPKMYRTIHKSDLDRRPFLASRI